MIPVRIVYTDTATGCETSLDTTVSNITTESVLKAINKSLREAVTDEEDMLMGENYMIKDAKQDTYAFILSIPHVPYFGSMLIHGVVYTQFV